MGLGVLLIAFAVPAVGGATGIGGGTGEDEPAPVTVEAVTRGGAGQAIIGTELTVPVPDPKIGTVVKDLAIPMEDTDAVVRGVAFYRAGPMKGSVVGGVSVVYDDSASVRAPEGGVADADAIAAMVNPEVRPVVETIGKRTVLGWPDSEVVPSEGIPQQDRSVSRYVVLLDEGIVMVTFDDVDAQQAEGYLVAVAGAL